MTAQPRRLDVAVVYADHADFVWASLHRLGVAEADLPDLLQEVFVVVHRRSDAWDGVSSLRSWLFGIALRLTMNHRRKAYRRRERMVDAVPEVGGGPSPEREAQLADERSRARAVVDALPPERRAVFVMFEVEGLDGHTIARELGIPVGTVHSRLHKARNEIQAHLARLHAARPRRT